jgi:pimeloyl-ACP methyl ester carboxylesterase
MSISPTVSRFERQAVATRFGEVAYLEAGHGPAAVFIHGVFLNADLWHHQLEGLADLRRCLAVDLLAHGGSPYLGAEELTVSLQADMVVGFLDALGLDSVDLVGNDSGGAIAQLVVARIPGRVRSLTLTNCDTHDNWPPAAFEPIVDLARQGVLAGTLRALAVDPATARASLSSGFEHPEALSDQVIEGFFGPIGSSGPRAEAIQSYVAGMDNRVTVAIRDDLAGFRSPTLIVWGTADEFFDVEWARWLATTIPGTVRCVEIDGAKVFFPMERASAFNEELRGLWTSTAVRAALEDPETR